MADDQRRLALALSAGLSRAAAPAVLAATAHLFLPVRSPTPVRPADAGVGTIYRCRLGGGAGSGAMTRMLATRQGRASARFRCRRALMSEQVIPARSREVGVLIVLQSPWYHHLHALQSGVVQQRGEVGVKVSQRQAPIAVTVRAHKLILRERLCLSNGEEASHPHVLQKVGEIFQVKMVVAILVVTAKQKRSIIAVHFFHFYDECLNWPSRRCGPLGQLRESNRTTTKPRPLGNSRQPQCLDPYFDANKLEGPVHFNRAVDLAAGLGISAVRMTPVTCGRYRVVWRTLHPTANSIGSSTSPMFAFVFHAVVCTCDVSNVTS
mmetsp:Transcript_35495/g.68040  ORF Transcript_35495/g.68040 Transcript_35495/m.68040 type:complete len:322 (+) Transcript_35495:1314-2279(+)